MTAISIFAKPTFINSGPDGPYPKRVSSAIRGDQIATKLKAKLNPLVEFNSDICIYVKPDLDQNRDFTFFGKRTYIDIIDELSYTDVLRKHPKLGAIVLSEKDYVSLSSEKLPNKIVLIPQHHCNFKRQKRIRKQVKTVGMIGNKRAFPSYPLDLENALKERGLNLIKFSDFFDRQSVIDFYLEIDLQIVWRPWRKRLANPLKIVNAASFGIPTIALDEPYFQELGSAYVGVKDFPGFLHQLDRLRLEPALYNCYKNLCLQKAENYHLENIAKLYRKL